MTKSLTNKFLLKQHMFNLRMQEDMSLREHLDKLNSILLDMRNIDFMIDDVDVALILLVSLPLSYDNFRKSFTSGKDSSSLKEVRSALHSRELWHSCSGIVSDGQVVGLVALRNMVNKGKISSLRNQLVGFETDLYLKLL